MAVLLIQLCGCYSMREIPKDELAGLKEVGDIIVHTKDSTIYSFKEFNYHISNDSLYGKGYVKFNDASDFKVPIESPIALTNINTLQREELNSTNTTWLIIGCVLSAAVVVLGIHVLLYLGGI